MRWVCETQFPTLIYNLLTLDPPEQEGPGMLDGNIRLYQLLYQLRERRQRLTRLLSRSVLGRRCRWAGASLAPAHDERGVDAAFVEGVFPLLVQSQNAVSWTPPPLAEDDVMWRLDKARLHRPRAGVDRPDRGSELAVTQRFRTQRAGWRKPPVKDTTQ